MPRDFSERSLEAELMDGEGVDLDTFRGCLADLATVNTLTLTRRPTLAWLARATRDRTPGERFSVLDVGYGHGDMLRAIHAWSRKRGLHADLVGVDLNPWSETVAREATPPDMDIDYRTGDVFAFDPGRRFDFVISAQVTHHLSDGQLVAFLRWMEATAVRGWFVSDLHRHAVPFHAFRLLSRLAGWHPFVRHDGPVSIARSFRRDDWERLLTAAGIDPAAVEIRWHVPFRLCVGRIK
jgi:SAM-dependent methyltransferase